MAFITDTRRWSAPLCPSGPWPVPPTSGPLPGGRRARPVLSAPGPARGRASEHPRSSRPEHAAPHSGDCRFLRSRGQQSAQKRSASSAQDTGSCSHLPTQQSEPLAWPGPKASRAPRPPAQPQGQPQRRRPPRTSLLLRLLSPRPPPPAQWQPLPIRSSIPDLLTGAVPSLFLGLLSSYGLRDPARVLSIHRLVPAAEDIAEFLIPFPLAHWQL